MAILRRQVRAPRHSAEYDPSTAAVDARRIAEHYTIPTIPLDAVGLARALGITVSMHPLADSVSGYLKPMGSGWQIGVNSLHHPNRQRFTMAHELGHYFLHRDRAPFEDGLLFRRASNQSPVEREANQFAAMLLMPAHEFRRQSRHFDISEVARNFGVSRQAAEYRLNNVTMALDID